ncbi:MAG: galactonate dehydratase, partial [Cyclobacteriaceae bacterium]
MNHIKSRRKFFRNTTTSLLAGAFGLQSLKATSKEKNTKEAPIDPNDKIKITKLETFVLKNSWVFVKISTDAGIVGWGEMLKDDAKACAAGAMEVADYLIGKDP